ncbi:DUF4129 domain-containing protein [bacterium]|nr:DUF4129 domain-containing protein [bacterium]
MIARLCIASLLCAEALALYAFAELIANGYSTQPHAVAAWALIVAMGGAYLIPRLAGSFFESERNARIAITVAGIVLVYAVLRTQFAHDLQIWNFGWIADFLRTPADTFNRGSHAMVGFLFILCAWLWGGYRSNNDIEPELVTRSIAAPFIAVTLMVVIGAGTHRAGEIGRASVAFYAFDVLALVLAQLTLSGANLGTLRTGGVVATLMGGTVAAVLAGLVVVTLAFAVAGPVVGPPLGDGLTHLLTWVLTPFAWALEHLFELLVRGHSFPKLSPQNVAPAPLPQQHGDQPAGEVIGLYALRAAGIIILIVAIAAVIAFVARLRSRAKPASQAAATVAASGGLGEDMSDFFRRMFHRPPRGTAAADDAATRLYLEVLSEAERRGSSRPPSVTASEFVEPLRRTFPSAATEEITAAFEQARYAGRPPDEGALQRLRDRWQQAR